MSNFTCMACNKQHISFRSKFLANMLVPIDCESGTQLLPRLTHLVVFMLIESVAVMFAMFQAPLIFQFVPISRTLLSVLCILIAFAIFELLGTLVIPLEQKNATEEKIMKGTTTASRGLLFCLLLSSMAGEYVFYFIVFLETTICLRLLFQRGKAIFNAVIVLLVNYIILFLIVAMSWV